MAETFPHQTEQHPALPTAEQAEPLRPGEADPTRGLETEAHHAEALETARHEVDATTRAETQPNPLEALQEAEESSAAAPSAPQRVDQQLKQLTRDRMLVQIRRQLPGPQRVLSRVIHQPAVRVVSEAAGRTVSRPSGLLGGGVVAFLGTAGYLYLARHIGFTYNYLVFLLLFVGGFIIGLLLEAAVWTVSASRRRG